MTVILLVLPPLLLADAAGRHRVIVHVHEDARAIRPPRLQHVLADALNLREPGLAKGVFQLLLTELLVLLPALAAKALLVLLPVLLAKLLTLLTPVLLLPVLLATKLLALLVLLTPVLLAELLALLVLLTPVLLLAELLALPVLLHLVLLLAELPVLLAHLHLLVFLDGIELCLTLFSALLRSGDLPVLNLRDNMVVPDRHAFDRKKIDAAAVLPLDLDEALSAFALHDARHRADLLALLIDDLPVEKVGNGHLPKPGLLVLLILLVLLSLCLVLLTGLLGLARLLRNCGRSDT